MLGMYQYLDVFLTNLGVACTASAVSGRKIENRNKRLAERNMIRLQYVDMGKFKKVFGRNIENKIK
jgi:hypothetical protein